MTFEAEHILKQQHLQDDCSALDRFEEWVKSLPYAKSPEIPLISVTREMFYEGRGEICDHSECDFKE